MSNASRETETEVIIEAATKLGRLPKDVTPEQARADLGKLQRRRIKRLRWQAEQALRERDLLA